jgi:hypothetical protein
VSFREVFEALAHIVRRDTFEILGQDDEYKSEKETLKHYSWLKNP